MLDFGCLVEYVAVACNGFLVRFGGFNGNWFITPSQPRHMAHNVELGSHKREMREGCGFSKDIYKVIFARDEVHD